MTSIKKTQEPIKKKVGVFSIGCCPRFIILKRINGAVESTDLDLLDKPEQINKKCNYFKAYVLVGLPLKLKACTKTHYTCPLPKMGSMWA